MRRTLYTIIFIFLLQNTVNANEIEGKLQTFFATFVGHMNDKNPQAVSNFLFENSDKDVEIRKKVIKLQNSSTDLSNFTIDELTMDLTEYELFIGAFFKGVSAYAINHKLTNFNYNTDDDTIFATVEYTEYATVRKLDEESKRNIEIPVYINSNCSYSFSNTTGLPRLYHNICIEKIVRNEPKKPEKAEELEDEFAKN